MAWEALTEPLLPRGRDESSTPRAHSIVNIAAATTATVRPAHRRSINIAPAARAKYPGFAVDREAALENGSASTTAALRSAFSLTTPWEDRPASLPPVAVRREVPALRDTIAVDHAAALKNASALTLWSASPSTTGWQDRRANLAPDAAIKGASASPPATPSPGRRAKLLASLGPARGSITAGKGLPPSPTPASKADLSISASGADDPPRAASPSSSSVASVFLYTSMSDALRRSASPADYMGSESEAAAISLSPIEDASLPPLRGRNSPRISLSTEISRSESVVEHSDDGSTSNDGVERKGPKKDSWDRESFMYTCVLVLLIGLVAYLSTVLDGWSPVLRGIFIGIFGVSTGVACVGAMALISETPDPSMRHFAHIVSRLTFIVGSIAFEAAVFYLLGVVGFIAWLVLAIATILGMMYIWKEGSPESFGALVSCLSTAE